MKEQHKRWFSRDKLPLWVIGVFSAIIFTWSAVHNGWMNEYYSAAAVSGAENAHAFFFGSFDSAGFISVDKPPLGIWPSSLAVILLGPSPLAVALPHIVAGIATALLLFVSVRRIASARLGLLTAGLFLLTPITSVLFGYNQPDSFFALFLSAATYWFVRYLKDISHPLRWVPLIALALGLAFMTKTLQVLPAVLIFGGACLVILFKQGLRRQGVIAGTAAIFVFLITAAWWPLVVAMTPVQSRPFVGSTQDNSPWSLIAGYNGLDRLTQPDQVQSQTTLVGAQFGGDAGVFRLFNSEFAPLASWFIPLLIPALIGILYRKNRADSPQRILVATSSGIVLAYGLLFSLMRGVIHPYYVLAFAPSLAIVASFALQWMIGWYRQKTAGYRFILPAMLAVVAFTSALILNNDTANWAGVIVACLGMAVTVILVIFRHHTWQRGVIWALSIFIVGIGPILQTSLSLSRAHTGVYPSVIATGDSPTASPSDAAISFLQTHRLDTQTWLAVTESTQFAAPLELATHRPVMALGGFNGTDPVMTLPALQQKVARGEVSYFVISTSLLDTINQPSTVQWLLMHRVVYKDASTIIYELRTNHATKQ